MFEDKVLEGVNRTEACKRLNIKVKARQYPGNDPIGFVLSANLHRRHLDASQRAIVAAKLADLELGANQNTPGTPIGVAAKLLNVGRGSIDRARVVLKSGEPELIKAVETGEIPVSKAAEQVKSGKAKRKTKASKPSAKTLLKQVETFEATWEQFDGWQKRKFIKDVKDEIVELVEELEAEEAAEEEANDQQAAAAWPGSGLDADWGALGAISAPITLWITLRLSKKTILGN